MDLSKKISKKATGSSGAARYSVLYLTSVTHIPTLIEHHGRILFEFLVEKVGKALRNRISYVGRGLMGTGQRQNQTIKISKPE